MRAITLITVTLLSLTSSLIFAQADRLFNGQNNDRTATTSFDRLFQQENKPDYKIISSNSSYFEIEFYPSITNQKLNIQSGVFDFYDFKNDDNVTEA
jgi:hypothetical protein